MPDKAPELYEKIQRLFEQKFQQDGVIQDLYQLILEGNADYKEAGEFAIRTGELLAQVFETTFDSETLPDGRLYLNIAQRTVEPMLKGNYELVTDVCGQVQEQLNRKAGLGLKTVKPKLNQDRINGILNKLSNEPRFDDVAWMLAEPVVNFTQSIVDDAVRENADFQYRAGLHPKIVRTSTGNCCKWCDKLAGTYDYNDLPDDIYRRHNHCRCRVEFLPGDGRRQNVHTKKWTEPGQADKIRERKLSGLKPGSEEVIRNIKNNLIPSMNRERIAPRQDIHRQGTAIYETRRQALAKKGQYGPSYITVSDDEILHLVKQYSGTGLIKVNANGNWNSQETIMTNDKIIGVVVNNLNGKTAETTVFKIHYAKDGIHIVPDYPSKKR